MTPRIFILVFSYFLFAPSSRFKTFVAGDRNSISLSFLINYNKDLFIRPYTVCAFYTANHKISQIRAVFVWKKDDLCKGLLSENNSSILPVDYGVVQGSSTLGPIMFSRYVNNIPKLDFQGPFIHCFSFPPMIVHKTHVEIKYRDSNNSASDKKNL